MQRLWRLCVVGVACAAVAFTLHVSISRVTSPLVSSWMVGHSILRPPYPWSITALAAASSFLPAFASVLIASLLYERLPGRTPTRKGLAFGLLLLLIKGELVRMPLMNIAVGNPWYVALTQQADKWLANLALGVCAALGIAYLKRRRLLGEHDHPAPGAPASERIDAVWSDHAPHEQVDW